MKTKEFMAKVRSLELEIEMEGCWIVIRTISGAKQLKINKNYASVVFFRGNYSCEIDRNLLNLVVGYLNTPNEEREEEKRYWLQKIPVPLLDKEGEKKWLWKYTGTAPSNMFGVDTTKIDSELYKTIFTESEIAEMDITGFKKEPVE